MELHPTQQKSLSGGQTTRQKQAALALANYVITILGGAGTDTVLDTALASLANTYGVWNSRNTVYSPFN
jgi:hypothetical protein